MYYVTVQAFNSANKQLNVSATSDGGKFYKSYMYMMSYVWAFLLMFNALVLFYNDLKSSIIIKNIIMQSTNLGI